MGRATGILRKGSAAGCVASGLALGSGGSVGRVGVAAGEPVDAPLPDVTPAQLAAKIREAMGRYDDRGSFRIVFTDTRDMNSRFTMNRGTPRSRSRSWSRSAAGPATRATGRDGGPSTTR